jgi:hypothetical protein
MVFMGSLAHNSRFGLDLETRCLRFTKRWRLFREAIANSNALPEEIVASWLATDQYRRVILWEGARIIGVGIALGIFGHDNVTGTERGSNLWSVVVAARKLSRVASSSGGENDLKPRVH